MVWPLALKKTGLWDRGMAFDVRVQNVLEKKTNRKKKPGLTDRGVATGVKKTRLTDRGVATEVIKFRMASSGLKPCFWNCVVVACNLVVLSCQRILEVVFSPSFYTCEALFFSTYTKQNIISRQIH